MEEFKNSDVGRRAAEHAAQGGGLNSLLDFGAKEAVELHEPGSGHLIDIPTRVLMATLVNRVVAGLLPTQPHDWFSSRQH